MSAATILLEHDRGRVEHTLLRKQVLTLQFRKSCVLDGITDTMDMNLGKFQEIVRDKGAWGAALHEVTKRWTWLDD